MAKSFNITPTLKKNVKDQAILAKKTTFKKTLKDVDIIKEKVEKIHDEVPEVVKTKVKETAVKERAKTSAAKATPKRSSKKRGTTVITEDSKRMTVVMPKDTHRLLKIKAINSEITLNEFIVNLIEKNLGIK